ncbi:MAG: riboflavin synthase [Alphaproteobacteria bacterium]|nr:riboflavin synthase [Alphaproteobacteria bacterium]
MFTGIITDIGTVQSKEVRGDSRFIISTAYAHDSIDLGASIACSGVCLTVINKGYDTAYGDWFSVDVSAETLACTTLEKWREGREINLERALRMGDELGGHMVSGHVDGVGKICEKYQEGDSVRMAITAPEEVMRFMAAKGSVTVDGVSLTVNFVTENSLNLNIIPHTLYATTLSRLDVGDKVNLEIDVIARYVQRLIEQK